jgi:hypothetical protein
MHSARLLAAHAPLEEGKGMARQFIYRQSLLLSNVHVLRDNMSCLRELSEVRHQELLN